jgi:tripartite-type tricarboxylate transporter receptor subunit TctC
MRLAAFAIAFVVATGVAAQTYPTVAERLAVKWGQGVPVENRAGGGIPGMMAGKQAAPDGYTLIVGTSGTLGVNVNIYGSIPYDPLKWGEVARIAHVKLD